LLFAPEKRLENQELSVLVTKQERKNIFANVAMVLATGLALEIVRRLFVDLNREPLLSQIAVFLAFCGLAFGYVLLALVSKRWRI
jgi:hypothetical protein